MTTGKIDDAETRQRLEAAGWQTGDYGDFLDLSDGERAIVESRLEIGRLEREVIEAAKKWHWLHVADRTLAPAAQEASYSVATDSLSASVAALLAFAAEQKK